MWGFLLRPGALTACPTPTDHQKLCYSALILAMVFSMGEAVPYAHYGKSLGIVRGLQGALVSWCWDPGPTETQLPLSQST